MKIFLKIFLIILLITSPVYACIPCRKTLNFYETAQKADLIIIGQKIDEDFINTFYNKKPEWTKVKILEIIKGDTSANEIRVKSWYGMCAYGIVLLDKNPYVIFLQKGKDMYYPVNTGCAIKYFKVEGENVYFQEESLTNKIQKISIDELVRKIGPSATRKKITEDKQEKFSPSLKFFIIILGTVIFALVIFIIGVVKFRHSKDKK